MLNVVQEVSEVKRHTVFFDNFFTSFRLLRDLGGCGVKAAGTFRVTRTGGVIQHLKSDKDLKQEGRGAHDFISDGLVM